ncbi:MAG: chaperone modulator CbpM [Flavobacteriaceae bacterium]|nr:chaperone modulator CbpM [Flavobacteriaceae bacterium]
MKASNLIPIKQFCERYEIEFSFIDSLNDYGLIEITYIEKDQFIEIEKIHKVEKLIRLHDELGVNFEGIDIITNLMQKIEDLQNEINSIQNRLNIYED